MFQAYMNNFGLQKLLPFLVYLLLQHCSLGPDLHTQLQSLLQAQLLPHFCAVHWQSVEIKLVSIQFVLFI